MMSTSTGSLYCEAVKQFRRVDNVQPVHCPNNNTIIKSQYIVILSIFRTRPSVMLLCRSLEEEPYARVGTRYIIPNNEILCWPLVGEQK